MSRVSAVVLLTIPLLMTTAVAAPPLAQQEQAAFKAAATAVADSIVQVQPFGGLDRVGQTRTGTGPGSAIIMSADGYLMSSAFLFASKPAAVLVTLPDGSRHDAALVATDYSRMLTLLKIDPAGLKPDAAALVPPPTAPLDGARVGQWTLAVGKAFDPQVPNLSAGLLSAKNRIWGKALQTDCKTSPFNYGGPLIDLDGDVLGLITPLSMMGDDVMAGADWYDSGIGFAVPMDQVQAAFERLKSGSDLKRGTLGLAVKGKGPFAESIVAAVSPDGPAAQAGLQAGDQITAIDGMPVARQAEMQQALGPHYAGDTIAVVYRRGDAEQTAQVTLAEPPAAPLKPAAQPETEQPPGGKDEPGGK